MIRIRNAVMSPGYQRWDSSFWTTLSTSNASSLCNLLNQWPNARSIQSYAICFKRKKKKKSNSHILVCTNHATNKISLRFVWFSALNKFVFWEYAWKRSIDIKMSLWLCTAITCPSNKKCIQNWQYFATKLSREVAKRVVVYTNLVGIILQKQQFKCLVLNQYYEHTNRLKQMDC